MFYKPQIGSLPTRELVTANIFPPSHPRQCQAAVPWQPEPLTLPATAAAPCGLPPAPAPLGPPCSAASGLPTHPASFSANPKSQKGSPRGPGYVGGCRNAAARSQSCLRNSSLSFPAAWEVGFSASLLLEGRTPCTSAAFSTLCFTVTGRNYSRCLPYL